MSGEGSLVVRFVDAMERVYPDRVPTPDPDAARLHAVRGGCAAVVVAVRVRQPGAISIRFDGWGGRMDWPAPKVHWMKPVRVQANTVCVCKPGRWDPEQAQYLLRRAPFQVCEALWPGQEWETAGGRTEAFLLLFEFPRNAQPGKSAFRVSVRTSAGANILTGTVAVHAACLPDPQRLKVTQWLGLHRLLHPYSGMAPWSSRHWRMIEQALTMVRRGGQNTILLPMTASTFEKDGHLVDAARMGEGRYRFDFRRFDRFVRLALRLGYRYLEGGHIGGKKLNAAGKCNLKDPYVYIQIPDSDGKPGKQISAESDEAKIYLRQFFGALRKHLARRGWLENFWQYVADEPFRASAESYCRMVDFVRSVFPGVRLADAASDHSAGYALDMPVPEIDYLDSFPDFYRGLKKQGKEYWLYVCCAPIGPWPNRFLDFHLNKGGLLPWFCFHYGATGFLHWAAAQWYENSDPYEESHFQGDAFILYPGPNGPVGSMRWLAMRLGVEDYELMAALANEGGRAAAAAQRLCNETIQDGTHYTYDTPSIRAARIRLRGLAARYLDS